MVEKRCLGPKSLKRQKKPTKRENPPPTHGESKKLFKNNDFVHLRGSYFAPKTLGHERSPIIQYTECWNMIDLMLVSTGQNNSEKLLKKNWELFVQMFKIVWWKLYKFSWWVLKQIWKTVEKVWRWLRKDFGKPARKCKTSFWEIAKCEEIEQKFNKFWKILKIRRWFKYDPEFFCGRKGN